MYDGIGWLTKNKLITPEMAYKLSSTNIIWQWSKWEDVIKELRKRYGMAGTFEDFEYVADLMAKMKKERAPSFKVPETFTKYIPDKASPP